MCQPNHIEIAMKLRWIFASASLFLGACGEEQKPYKPPVPQTPASTLFQHERQALDKAKGVEQTAEDHARMLEQKSREE